MYASEAESAWDSFQKTSPQWNQSVVMKI